MWDDDDNHPGIPVTTTHSRSHVHDVQSQANSSNSASTSRSNETNNNTIKKPRLSQTKLFVSRGASATVATLDSAPASNNQSSSLVHLNKNQQLKYVIFIFLLSKPFFRIQKNLIYTLLFVFFYYEI